MTLKLFFTLHSSLFTLHCFPLHAPHSSLFTIHCPLLPAPPFLLPASRSSLLTPHYSLFTALCFPLPASRFTLPALHHSSFITHHSSFTFRSSPLSPQSSVLSPVSSPFLFPAPVITCYCGESNPKLSIKSVCCAISPCICPVFTGITVKMKRFWLQFGGVKSPGGTILPANRSCLVEFGKFGFSLFTDHCSLQSRCRLAKLIRSAAQYWSR